MAIVEKHPLSAECGLCVDKRELFLFFLVGCLSHKMSKWEMDGRVDGSGRDGGR